MATAEMVDWELADATAARLVRPGPVVTAGEAAAAVAELRRDAEIAQRHVGEFAELDASAGGSPALIVDRHRWVSANLTSFRMLSEPLADRIAERMAERGVRTTRVPGANPLGMIGPRVTALELGSLLAYLSHRVLGQYEIFAPLPDGGHGRLLLVAPNIVRIERELRLDPHDFRLWVCLHEETHRTQFTAVPWLREYLVDEIRAFMKETPTDMSEVADRLRAAATAALAGPRRRGEAPLGTSLIELVQTPGQRKRLDRLVAVMSLLEGHADYVMDGVGPRVVPSVSAIRREFDRRRQQGAGRLDAALRRVLGLDAKLRQYRDGERFVRYVVQRCGMAGFNQIWSGPDTLPARSEIHDPAAWLQRVMGDSVPE
jgi:coenzyme F420 biosynthesis associated uncharacterized protein